MLVSDKPVEDDEEVADEKDVEEKPDTGTDAAEDKPENKIETKPGASWADLSLFDRQYFWPIFGSFFLILQGWVQMSEFVLDGTSLAIWFDANNHFNNYWVVQYMQIW